MTVHTTHTVSFTKEEVQQHLIDLALSMAGEKKGDVTHQVVDGPNDGDVRVVLTPIEKPKRSTKKS